jgi:hypothetical protein
MNDKNHLDAHFSRRAMLEATLGMVGMVSLCGLATTRAAAAAARNSPTLRYFTAGEAATIDALVAQIIPTDDTPGARAGEIQRNPRESALSGSGE